MTQPNIKPWAGPLAVGGLFAALLWLERRRPLRAARPEADSTRLPRNLALAGATGAVINRCERPLTEPLAKWVDQHNVGLIPMLKLPPVAEKVLALILSDYSLYWWHILLHRVPILWRSHVVHHADLVLDTSTALRFHFWEFLVSIPWRLGQIVLIGLRPNTLALWQRLTLMEVMFHHSNLRLPLRLEDKLRKLIVTPRVHGIHHSVRQEETDSNFSSGLVIWDHLHGTQRTDVPQSCIEIGVPAYHKPRELTLPRLLALPFEHQRPSFAQEG